MKPDIGNLEGNKGILMREYKYVIQPGYVKIQFRAKTGRCAGQTAICDKVAIQNISDMHQRSPCTA